MRQRAMSLDANALMTAVKWSESGHQLHEFSKAYELPQMGKIIKGQYAGVGAPSLSSPSLNQIVLWASGGKRVSVVAQSVRFKDGRNSNMGRAVAFGPKLVIPDNFDGWWEILSEEGKSVRCIETVADLAKRYPESCLVRETTKAFLAKPEDPSQLSDKVRTVQIGELLTLLAADVIATNAKSGGVRYLRCRSSKGDTIYLSFEQKAKFSPVAKEGISGVHSIRNLLTKRMPLMARLVHGKPPQGFKNFQSSVRLFSTFEEECLVAMPLHKEPQTLVQVPIGSALKVIGPKNANELSQMKELMAFVDSSKQLINNLTDRIHLLDSQLVESGTKVSSKSGHNSLTARLANKLSGHHHDHKRRLQSNFLVKRSSSDPQPLNQEFECTDELKRGTSLDESQSNAVSDSRTESLNNENDQFYREIDQIYDYVRGFAPLPHRIKSEFDSSKLTEPLKTSILNNENKPEPPPIITIPSIQNRRTSDPVSPQKHSINAKKGKKLFQNKDSFKNKKEVKVMPNVRFAYYAPNNVSAVSPVSPLSPVSGVNGGSAVSGGKVANAVTRMYAPPPPPPPPPPPVTTGGVPAGSSQKLFVKSSSGQRNTWKCNRFLKYAKQVSSPFRSEQKSVATKEVANQTCRSSRSLTTSPIFNIRYKSMNNLHFITPPALNYSNTIESSHSGHTSSGSGSKDLFRDPKSKLPKLSRSLTNVFWDVSGNLIAIDTINKLNNELNDRKNMTCPQLLPVHIDFLNAIDKLQQNQHIQHIHQIKEHNGKNKQQLPTLYL